MAPEEAIYLKVNYSFTKAYNTEFNIFNDPQENSGGKRIMVYDQSSIDDYEIPKDKIVNGNLKYLIEGVRPGIIEVILELRDITIGPVEDRVIDSDTIKIEINLDKSETEKLYRYYTMCSPDPYYYPATQISEIEGEISWKNPVIHYAPVIQSTPYHSKMRLDEVRVMMGIEIGARLRNRPTQYPFFQIGRARKIDKHGEETDYLYYECVDWDNLIFNHIEIDPIPPGVDLYHMYYDSALGTVTYSFGNESPTIRVQACPFDDTMKFNGPRAFTEMQTSLARVPGIETSPSSFSNIYFSKENSFDSEQLNCNLNNLKISYPDYFEQDSITGTGSGPYIIGPEYGLGGFQTYDNREDSEDE